MVWNSFKQFGRLLHDVIVKSGSTPVGGPVKSGRKRTKDKGRGLDKKLVQLELVVEEIPMYVEELLLLLTCYVEGTI